jgi:formylglycine-generating enzyme
MTPFPVHREIANEAARRGPVEIAKMTWSRVKRGIWVLGAWLLSGSGPLAAEMLRDCPECSPLVVIRGGTFTMGSPANEPERKKLEGPRDNVRVAAFAIGATEVTRGQYALFVKQTRRPAPARGCFTYGFNHIIDSNDIEKAMDTGASWRNPAFRQDDDHPATCISWKDAKDYSAWLARKTGKPYRLPSEAEWEYAARAGSTAIFLWGSDENAACEHANVGDLSLSRANSIVRGLVETALRAGDRSVRFVDCDDGQPYTAPVARYRPNAFGLYDTIGNVWEYVEDCWQESLPENGLAQRAASCEHRRVRGGSWDDAPAELRSARRSRVKPDVPRNDAGFRLARDLTPAEIPR